MPENKESDITVREEDGRLYFTIKGYEGKGFSIKIYKKIVDTIDKAVEKLKTYDKGKIWSEELEASMIDQIEKLVPKEEDDSKIISIPSYMGWESVILNTKPQFIKYEGNEPKTLEEIKDPKTNFTYVPATGMVTEDDDYIDDLPYVNYYLLTPDLTRSIDTNELFDRVYKELTNYVYFYDKHYPYVLTMMVLLSGLQKIFQTIPYMFPVGDNESGKTTLMDILSMLCFRGVNTSDASAASIHVALSEHGAGGMTLFEDEAQDLWKKENAEKLKIYRTGYRKRAVVPRVRESYQALDGVKVKYAPTYCLKIIAGETVPNDRGFKQRLIQIDMIQGKPNRIFGDRDKDDKTRLQRLRSDLMLWWLQMREKVSGKDANFNLSGRVGDKWNPLLAVASKCKYREIIEEACKQHALEYSKESTFTVESVILKAVMDFMDKEKHTVTFYIFWKALWMSMSDQPFDATKDDRSFISKDHGKISKAKVVSIITDKFHGKRLEMGHDKNIVYQLDIEILDKLKQKYGLVVYKPETTATSDLETAAYKMIRIVFADKYYLDWDDRAFSDVAEGFVYVCKLPKQKVIEIIKHVIEEYEIAEREYMLEEDEFKSRFMQLSEEELLAEELASQEDNPTMEEIEKEEAEKERTAIAEVNEEHISSMQEAAKKAEENEGYVPPDDDSE